MYRINYYTSGSFADERSNESKQKNEAIGEYKNFERDDR